MKRLHTSEFYCYEEPPHKVSAVQMARSALAQYIKFYSDIDGNHCVDSTKKLRIKLTLRIEEDGDR